MAEPAAPADHAVFSTAVVTAGNLVVNLDNYHVDVAGLPVLLSYQEFELLRVLIGNVNRVLDIDALTDLLWQARGRTYVRRLNVVVHRLRLKLEHSRPYQIESVRNRGYGLVTVPDEPSG